MKEAGGPLIDVGMMSDWERRTKLGSGDLLTLGKGIYIEKSVWQKLGRRSRVAARIVAKSRSCPTLLPAGKSAAILHGMPLSGWEDSHPIEMAGPGASSARRTTKGVRYRNISRRQMLASEEVLTEFGSIKVTTATMTGLDIARWHGLGDAVRCLDHGLGRGTVTRESIARGMALMGTAHGVATMREAVSLATPWSESPRESDLKVALWRAGLPPPHQQASLHDEKGNFLARLDFLWPEIGYGVEYDGAGKYTGKFGISEDSAASQDMRRQHRIVNMGVFLFRVNNGSFLDGSAVREIVAMHARLRGRGVPLDPKVWRSEGKAW